MLGKNPSPGPALPSYGKSSNPIKIVKRDAHSLRIKLAVGALPEKIITSFQSVLDQNVSRISPSNLNFSWDVLALDGDSVIAVCSSPIHIPQIKYGRLIGEALSSVPWSWVDVSSSVLRCSEKEQESVLQQCINQLESSEATRTALVSLLKDALQNQDPALERIRTQLQHSGTEPSR